jgi:hypothetical protein
MYEAALTLCTPLWSSEGVSCDESCEINVTNLPLPRGVGRTRYYGSVLRGVIVLLLLYYEDNVWVQVSKQSAVCGAMNAVPLGCISLHARACGV